MSYSAAMMSVDIVEKLLVHVAASMVSMVRCRAQPEGKIRRTRLIPRDHAGQTSIFCSLYRGR